MAQMLVRGRHVVCRVIGRSDAEIVNDGAVVVDGGAIVEVGRFDDMRSKYPAGEVIGSDRYAVIPGLINSHHHVGLTPFQLGALDAPLESWIIARWAIRDVDPYLDTLWCAIQMIESGITTVQHNHMAARLPLGVELYDAASEIVNAYEDSGMRVAFSLSTRDQNHLVYEDDTRFLSTLPTRLADRARGHIAARPISLEEYLAACGELHARRQGPRTNIFVSPHNVHWCSDEMLTAISDFARMHGTGFHIHLQETIYQRMYGTRHWNGTPLAHLAELGVLGPEVSCAHGVWLSESDVDILGETDTAICTNPSSNLRLKSGVAPINQAAQGRNSRSAGHRRGRYQRRQRHSPRDANGPEDTPRAWDRLSLPHFTRRTGACHGKRGEGDVLRWRWHNRAGQTRRPCSGRSRPHRRPLPSPGH